MNNKTTTTRPTTTHNGINTTTWIKTKANVWANAWMAGKAAWDCDQRKDYEGGHAHRKEQEAWKLISLEEGYGEVPFAPKGLF